MGIINRIMLSSIFACLFVATLMYMSGAQITSWYVPQTNPYLPQGFEFSEFLQIRPLSTRFWDIFRSLNQYFDTVFYYGQAGANPLSIIPVIPQIDLIPNADGFLIVLNVLIMFVNGLSSVINVITQFFNFIFKGFRYISQFFFTLSAFLGSLGTV